MTERLLPYMLKTDTGIYRYRRQIPQGLREALGVREIKKSLGSDYIKAVQTYQKVHAEADKAVADAKAGDASDFDMVARMLKKAGLSGQDLAALVNGNAPEELREGLRYILDADGLADEYEAAERKGKTPRLSVEAIKAINAGRVPEKVHTITTALAFYLDFKHTGDTAKDRQRENRVENLKRRIALVLGEDGLTKRPLQSLTRKDANAIRDMLMVDLAPNSVERMLSIVKASVNMTIREHDLDMRNPFDHQKIKGAGSNKDSRLPLTEDEMKALASVMNKGTGDPRSVLWVVLRDSGARLSEIATGKVSQVNLTARSYSVIKGKSVNAARTFPLSPEALEGLKAMAAGKGADDYLFPKYAEGRGPDSASQALNKRLRKVLKERKKVVYSLRHRMKDRLREVNCPKAIQEEIMGHDDQRVADDYGSGYSLEKKREYLEAVWSTTPK